MAGFRLRHAARGAALLAMAAELRRFNADMAWTAARLARLQPPLAILAGGADRIAPADWHARWLARRVPGAVLRELPTSGHMPHHTGPAEVAAAIASLRDPARAAEQDSY